MQQRVHYIDGLRGIAIMLVIGFHAYARWPEYLPYADLWADVPAFQYGYLGVQLFFVISGYVILLTLERSTTASGFIAKRWLRLFPAMLIACALIFATAPIIGQRPGGMPQLSQLIPSLSLIEPAWLSQLFGGEWHSIEGAFWSLYVEFKFYLLAATCYFFIGKRSLVPLLLSLYVFALLAEIAYHYFPNSTIAYCYQLSLLGSWQYFAWFAAGALFYQSTHEAENHSRFAFGIAVLLLAAIASSRLNTATFIATMLVTGLFPAALKLSLLQRALCSAPLLFTGFISYPLYLIHENALIALTAHFARYVPEPYQVIVPIGVVGCLMAVSFVIARYTEPWVRRVISAGFGALLRYIADLRHKVVKER
ncbi:acyltransferase family protein [Aliagarivorans taiwanensis]|uniref:acyltransferase family protein n=1 Tax=Aliagarivorans taiwanensis TaxID=561966 RepID=UPI0003FFB4C0|nr:acyltransferase [Aliagarivorans taiwanensis]